MGKIQTSLFLENKIKRMIKMNGEKYTFNKVAFDEFNQLTLTDETVEIEGVFYLSNNYISETNKDGGRITAKRIPRILTLYDGTKIQKDDVLKINDSKYKVISVNNINEFNVGVDISLEEIEDGNI